MDLIPSVVVSECYIWGVWEGLFGGDGLNAIAVMYVYKYGAISVSCFNLIDFSEGLLGNRNVT